MRSKQPLIYPNMFIFQNIEIHAFVQQVVKTADLVYDTLVGIQLAPTYQN